MHPSIVHKQMMIVCLRYSPINQAWSAPLLLQDPVPPSNQSRPTSTCLPAYFTSFVSIQQQMCWIIMFSDFSQFSWQCSFFHSLLYNRRDVNVTLDFPSDQRDNYLFIVSLSLEYMQGGSLSVEQTRHRIIVSKSSKFSYTILQQGQIKSKLFKTKGHLWKCNL